MVVYSTYTGYGMYLIKIGISIQQYRVCIGMHNVLKSNLLGSSQPSFNIQSVFEFLLGLASAASHYFKCVFHFVIFLTIIIDQFIYKFISHSTDIGKLPHTITYYPMKYHDFESNGFIVINCLIYCILKMICTTMSFCKRVGFKNTIKLILCRPFGDTRLGECLINIYTIWLFSINLLLLILTVPNIVNPGPDKNLNVIFQNVNGFVNLQTKSSTPSLFTTKVLEFQGYILNEKPDIVILNET